MSPIVRTELERAGVGRVDLHQYLPATAASFLAGTVSGLGFAAVRSSWAEGAGDGARWTGSRSLPRSLSLPVYVTGSRAQILERLTLWSLLLADGDPAVPADRPVLRWVEQDTGDVWRVRVVSDGVEDWRTNHRTWVRFAQRLRTEDPFVTRERPEQIDVRAGSGATRGLLTGPLSELRQSSSQATGTRTVTNAGDRPAPPRWEVHGPIDGLTLVSPSGQSLQWTGTLDGGETLLIDHAEGTVIDGYGTNRYSELAPAPRFWHVPAGVSQVEVILLGVDTTTRATGLWWPRRSFVF